MTHQYNIFIGSNQLIITDNSQICKSNSYTKVIKWNQCKISDLLLELEQQAPINFIVHSNELQDTWCEFVKQFDVIEAAGGLVINEDNQILLIFRNKLWDLPKGKIEPNEDAPSAALREVNEECGLLELKIIAPLHCTYHIYKLNDKYILKKSYWFAMGCPNQIGTPQKEEGIEQIIWVDQIDIHKYTQNMYASIKHLLSY